MKTHERRLVHYHVIEETHPSDEEWKTGTGLMGSMAPKFQKEPDLSDVMEPRLPVMKLCKLSPSGHLEIPRDVRDKWLGDPVRRNLFPNRKSLYICIF